MSVDNMSSGQTMRIAFALEAAANICGAVPLLMYPAQIMQAVSATSAAPSNMSISLAQWLGGVIFALTPQLLTTLPDTPTCIAQRPLAYQTLLAGELFLTPIMLWQLITRTEAERGISDMTMLMAIGSFAPLMGWRIFALGFRPQWFGNPKAPGLPAKKNL